MSNCIYNKCKSFLMLLILAFFFSSTSFAQDKKMADKDKKFDQLKGKIEKITVKVDGKDVVFEGEDAEKMGKHIKMFSKAPMMWMSDEDGEFEVDGHNVMMYRFNDKDELDWVEEGATEKKIEVKIEDGKKKVTVKTEKDGKEETKVYEGKEADEFLKENQKPGGKFQIKIDGDKGMGGNMMMFRKMAGDDDNGCCCCGKMNRRMHAMPFKGKGANKIIIEKKVEKEEKESKK